MSRNIGNLIISFDCEGKWGMADKVNSSHEIISHKNLLNIYKKLLLLLLKCNLKATFAFVGAFTLSEKERKKYSDYFKELTYEGKNWLANYQLAARERNLDGWFCPEAWDLVCCTDHEIASHGFTHIPYDKNKTSSSDVKFDLSTALFVAKEKGSGVKTFIYPRNIVGHQRVLRNSGLIAYRNFSKYKDPFSILLSELNLFEKSQKEEGKKRGLKIIPSGYFLNWWSGKRKLIPPEFTVWRWKNIILHAAKTGGTAHLWLHPHNLITAPKTLDILEKILLFAREMQEYGRIKSITQFEYSTKQAEKIYDS